MASRLLLQDACVLINLLSSGRFEDIARGCGYQLVVSTAVRAETVSIRDALSGESVEVDLTPHFATGLLELVDLASEEERSSYIAYAAQLDDGEAMSLALVEARHLPLATDDRKAISLIARERIGVELVSTTGVLQAWEANAGVSSAEMKAVLTAVRSLARFVPRVGTADRAWWDARSREA